MNINFFYVNKAMAQSLGIGPASLFGLIATICNLPGGTCSASFETLGTELGVNEKTARTWAKKLETNGYIERTHNDGGTYDMTIPEDVKVSLEFNIRKPRKKPDVPEEILILRGLLGHYPKKETWPLMIERLAGKSSEQIGRTYQVWCDQGYNPRNVQGWTEWLVKGIPSHLTTTGPVNIKVRPVAQETVKAEEFVPQPNQETF